MFLIGHIPIVFSATRVVLRNTRAGRDIPLGRMAYALSISPLFLGGMACAHIHLNLESDALVTFHRN